MRENTRIRGALATVAWGALLTVGAATGVALAPPAGAAVTSVTTLTSSANPSAAGAPVTLTATVTGDSPTGQVVFGEPGFTLGIADMSGGAATLVVSSFSVGAHALTATYSGDVNNDYSVGTLTQTVTAAAAAPAPAPPVAVTKPPKVKLVASTTKASVGDMVRLTWHSRNADTVMASGDWRGARKPKGSVAMRISERGKHVFKLTVANAMGRKTATVKVLAARKAKEFEVVVTDELVLVGSKVDVKADGFAKAEDFTLRLNGKVVVTGKADAKGGVSRTIVLPKDTPEGEVPLTITGSNPNRIGSAVLNVIGPKELEVQVAQEELYKRDEQTITVTGLLPGEAVTVTSLGVKLTTGTADDAGLFTYAFKVGKPLGEHTVTVTGAVPSRTGSATFTVLDPGRGPNNGG
jgi:hypothetical protein